MADREYWPDFLLEHGVPPCPGRPHPNDWLAPPLPSPLVGEDRGEGAGWLAPLWRVGAETGDQIGVTLGGILRFHWRASRGTVHASVHPDGTYELHETPAGDANAFSLVGGSLDAPFDSIEDLCAGFFGLHGTAHPAALAIAAFRCSIQPDLFRLAPKPDGGAELLPIGGDCRRDLRQALAAEWCISRFGAQVFLDRQERVARLLEEALELAQAEGFSAAAAHALVSHVFARPPGEPHQELGGLGVTLLVYAAARGFSADAAEATELSRISALPPGHFRARQDAKAAAGVARACEEAACGFLTTELTRRREAEGWVGVTRVGKRNAGRLLDGREHSAFPQTRSPA